MSDKVRVASFQQLKDAGRKIVMVTAYDYPGGRLSDEAGVDAVHVGDSVANILGYENEIPVTMEDMLHHLRAVRRGVERALLTVDMPFMSYKVSSEQALRNAARMVQEGGAEAVKMEGGVELAATVERVTQAGIPVLGHIGLRPQSIHAESGYSVKGREAAEVDRLLEDARALQDAGCFAIVLEAVGWDAAARVTASLRIPTIGIGAGAECDGQIMLGLEIFGLCFRQPARYVKRYAETADTIRESLRAFAREVRDGVYPDPRHAYLAKERRDAGPHR